MKNNKTLDELNKFLDENKIKRENEKKIQKKVYELKKTMVDLSQNKLLSKNIRDIATKIKNINGDIETTERFIYLFLADLIGRKLIKVKKVETIDEDYELLIEYSKYLEKKGYVDSDWRDEEPNAVDDYLGIE